MSTQTRACPHTHTHTQTKVVHKSTAGEVLGYMTQMTITFWLTSSLAWPIFISVGVRMCFERKLCLLFQGMFNK